VTTTFRGKMAEALAWKTDPVESPPGLGGNFAGNLYTETGTIAESEQLCRLAIALDGLDAVCVAAEATHLLSLRFHLIFYTASGCATLADAGAAERPEASRVVIEKPLAPRLRQRRRKLNRIVRGLRQGDQVFRIGTDTVEGGTVQNHSGASVRQTRSLSVWNRNLIPRADHRRLKPSGWEERAELLREFGAFARTMVQNHLTRWLALTTMEAPGRSDPTAIRQRKGQDSLQRPWQQQEPWKMHVRASGRLQRPAAAPATRSRPTGGEPGP